VVASAVNGLKPQRVSIVDEAGQLLADGAPATPITPSATSAERRFEKRMRSQVEAIVSSVVGAGRARVQLSADFDYNKITQTSDSFDPKAGCCARARPGKNPRRPPRQRPGHRQQRVAWHQDRDRRGRSRDQSKKSRGDQQLRDFPHHQDRSDRSPDASTASRSPCWSTAATPRTTRASWSIRSAARTSSDRIAALVRSAIGFDQKRGDQVEVVNLKFAEATAWCPRSAEPAGLLGMLHFTKDDVMYVIELGVMMLLGLVVLFMVIRPLVKRILAPKPSLAHGDGFAAGADRRAARHPGQNLFPNATAQLIDVAQVQGQVHAQSVHRVGELAERNPNETASFFVNGSPSRPVT
jgi:flagellar M-ring protein FliF